MGKIQDKEFIGFFKAASDVDKGTKRTYLENERDR
jgi:hypothetical protein